MSYIGVPPVSGDFVVLDAITTSATASYTLQRSSVNFAPESANHMLVSLNGTIQKPNSSFTISGSTITFSSALTSSDVIDFILVLGNVNAVGVATTVADSAITNAKTDFVSTSSAAGLQIKGDGTTDGTLQLNCSQNSHGVKLKSPAHSASQSYTLTLPATAPSADKFLQTDGSGNLSFADAGGGITIIDRWRVATTFTNSLDPIVWSQNTDSDSPSLGTAMTHSSGIFTFPQTGFWLIHAYYTGANAGTAGNHNYHVAFSTDSGSNYSQLCAGLQASQTYQQLNISCLAFFDVTNISTHRLKVYINVPSGASVYGQNNGNNLTRIDFLRIGDT